MLDPLFGFNCITKQNLYISRQEEPRSAGLLKSIVPLRLTTTRTPGLTAGLSDWHSSIIMELLQTF